MNKIKCFFALIGTFILSNVRAFASEADLAIPDLHNGVFHIFGGTVSAWDFLFYGALIITGTLGFSVFIFNKVKKCLPTILC